MTQMIRLFNLLPQLAISAARRLHEKTVKTMLPNMANFSLMWLGLFPTDFYKIKTIIQLFVFSLICIKIHSVLAKHWQVEVNACPSGISRTRRPALPVIFSDDSLDIVSSDWFPTGFLMNIHDENLKTMIFRVHRN